MTLKEVKAELREKIQVYKAYLKTAKKEESGIDSRGYPHKSSDYEMNTEIKTQLNECESIYKMLMTVKKLR